MSVILSRGDNRVGGVSSDAVLRREYAKRMTAPGQAVLRRHGAAGAFDPSRIAGLFAWFDGRTLEGLYSDGAGSTPAVVNGPVLRIMDGTGHGSDVSALSGGFTLRGTPKGPDLLGDNGLFLWNTNAVAGTGWTIGEGRATASSASGTLTIPIAATAGKVYLIRYYCSHSSGSVQASFGGASGGVRSNEMLCEEYVTAATTDQFVLTGTNFSGYVRNLQVFAADAADVASPYFLWTTGASALTAANPITDYPLNLFWRGSNQALFAGAVSLYQDSTNLKGATDTTSYDWQGGASGAYATGAEGARMMRRAHHNTIQHVYAANLIDGAAVTHGHTFGTLPTLCVGRMRPSDGYFSGRIDAVGVASGIDAAGINAIERELDADVACICWGDSMTAGNLSDAWTLYLRSRLGMWTENEGMGGQTSAQITSRFDAETGRKREWINILWMGTNDSPYVGGWEPTLANIAHCVSELDGQKRYLVLGVTVADGGLPPSYADDLDAQLAALYGDRFVDVRAYLQSYGDGSSNDNADIAAGLVPRSLRRDVIHLNGRGNQVVAKCLAERMQTLGWQR